MFEHVPVVSRLLEGLRGSGGFWIGEQNPPTDGTLLSLVKQVSEMGAGNSQQSIGLKLQQLILWGQEQAKANLK